MGRGLPRTYVIICSKCNCMSKVKLTRDRVAKRDVKCPVCHNRTVQIYRDR